jgi:UDP-glucose 4-epimerase
MKERALVTGGAGFIGSTLVRHLVESDVEVTVLDDLSTGEPANLEGVIPSSRLVVGSIRDPDLVRTLCQGQNLVFHLAAVASVQRSMQEPGATHDVNVTGFLNVLEGARVSGVRRVVYSSSAAVYGESDEFPLPETVACQPISPYGLHKQVNEGYATLYARRGWVETVGLRYFNVFGPRQDPHGDYAAVVPKFVDAFLGRGKLRIFGDGLQSRDFLFVDDIARANLLGAEVPGISGGIFNACSGRETSLLELVDMLSRITGRTLVPEHLPPRDGDIFRSVGDPNSIQTALGFSPRWTVEQGLTALLEWAGTH